MKLRTSETDPLRIAEIAMGSGVIGVTLCPGKRGSSMFGSAWARDLEADIAATDWARRLKRVFGIEIDTCQRCGGKLKIIASIEQPEVIAQILAHLEKTPPVRTQPTRRSARGEAQLVSVKVNEILVSPPRALGANRHP